MSRPETVERWRQRLQRFDPARMTVARFCQSEGISQPSFYKWKKTLRELSQQHSPRPTQPEVSFVPLRLSAPVENRAAAATDQAQCEQVAPLVASTSIELPGGVRVRVEVCSDRASVSSGEVRP